MLSIYLDKPKIKNSGVRPNFCPITPNVYTPRPIGLQLLTMASAINRTLL